MKLLIFLTSTLKFSITCILSIVSKVLSDTSSQLRTKIFIPQFRFGIYITETSFMVVPLIHTIDSMIRFFKWYKRPTIGIST